MHLVSQRPVNAVADFIHHSWDNTCKAVHDFTHKNCYISEEGYKAWLDVSDFQPNEITVKTVDSTVIIEAKHGEKDDGHGMIERHLIRKYHLPTDYDVTTVDASLSSDGILTIKAPVPKKVAGEERHVPISHSEVPIHMSHQL